MQKKGCTRGGAPLSFRR